MSSIESVSSRILADSDNPMLLVEVAAEDGLVGVGECWWGVWNPGLESGGPVMPIASMVDDVLAHRVVGRPCRSIEAIWQDLVRYAHGYGEEGVVLSAISGIDLALWDLLGQRLGVPAAQFLGGLVRPSIPVYASLTWLGDEDKVLAEVQRAVDAGFRAVKLHESDPELAVAARRMVGPDVSLMVDVNAAFDLVDAVAVAKRLHDAQVTWFEEPTWPPRDHRQMAKLRDRSPVPLAAGENEADLHSIDRLLRSGAVDYLQPEITRVGGLTGARKVGALAELHRVRLCPHNYSLGPSFFASLQWAASSPVGCWLEVPWLPAGQGFPSGIEVPALVDGEISVPELPGLGVPWPSS